MGKHVELDSLSDTAPFPFVFMSGVAIKPTVA
jgi:hypothetical protein